MHSTPALPGKALRLVSLSAISLAALLSGCSNQQDVRHRWCDPEPVLIETKPLVAPPPVATEIKAGRYKIRLEADALFQFDGSKLSQMTHSGKQALDALIAQIRGDFSRVDEILIVGHTDRLGSQTYNQRLSEQRAQTVKRYLQEHGITTPIEARGAGEAEPVTTDCKGSKASPALIQCLQPDRRVEVEVTGVRSTTDASSQAGSQR